jgi:hypothetical protein
VRVPAPSVEPVVGVFDILEKGIESTPRLCSMSPLQIWEDSACWPDLHRSQ